MRKSSLSIAGGEMVGMGEQEEEEELEETEEEVGMEQLDVMAQVRFLVEVVTEVQEEMGEMEGMEGWEAQAGEGVMEVMLVLEGSVCSKHRSHDYSCWWKPTARPECQEWQGMGELEALVVMEEVVDQEVRVAVEVMGEAIGTPMGIHTTTETVPQVPMVTQDIPVFLVHQDPMDQVATMVILLLMGESCGW